MHHSCLYQFSWAVHHTTWAEEALLQPQEVCRPPSKWPLSNAKCILPVGESQVHVCISCSSFTHLMWWSCDFVFSQQGEQAEWDFCQSNYLANSSLRMAGEARVSLHIHEMCYYLIKRSFAGATETAAYQRWFPRGVFCTLSSKGDWSGWASRHGMYNCMQSHDLWG